MGRKKIQIKTITDERNRQVIINALLIHCQAYLSPSHGPFVCSLSDVSLALNQRTPFTVHMTPLLTQDNLSADRLQRVVLS
jgi:hypothetical protein